jgi:hypothetical protein
MGGTGTITRLTQLIFTIITDKGVEMYRLNKWVAFLCVIILCIGSYSAAGANVPNSELKWPTIYHKGYVFGIRQNMNDASNAFVTLTNNLQHSPWSKNAEKFLAELAE